MTKTLTGNTRHRTYNPFWGPAVIVLEVEEATVKVTSEMYGGVPEFNESVVKTWRRATPDDMMSELMRGL